MIEIRKKIFLKFKIFGSSFVNIKLNLKLESLELHQKPLYPIDEFVTRCHGGKFKYEADKPDEGSYRQWFLRRIVRSFRIKTMGGNGRRMDWIIKKRNFYARWGGGGNQNLKQHIFINKLKKKKKTEILILINFIGREERGAEKVMKSCKGY